jgi:hypothetical protein
MEDTANLTLNSFLQQYTRTENEVVKINFLLNSSNVIEIVFYLNYLQVYLQQWKNQIQLDDVSLLESLIDIMTCCKESSLRSLKELFLEVIVLFNSVQEVDKIFLKLDHPCEAIISWYSFYLLCQTDNVLSGGYDSILLLLLKVIHWLSESDHYRKLLIYKYKISSIFITLIEKKLSITLFSEFSKLVIQLSEVSTSFLEELLDSSFCDILVEMLSITLQPPPSKSLIISILLIMICFASTTKGKSRLSFTSACDKLTTILHHYNITDEQIILLVTKTVCLIGTNNPNSVIEFSSLPVDCCSLITKALPIYTHEELMVRQLIEVIIILSQNKTNLKDFNANDCCKIIISTLLKYCGKSSSLITVLCIAIQKLSIEKRNLQAFGDYEGCETLTKVLKGLVIMNVEETSGLPSVSPPSSSPLSPFSSSFSPSSSTSSIHFDSPYAVQLHAIKEVIKTMIILSNNNLQNKEKFRQSGSSWLVLQVFLRFNSESILIEETCTLLISLSVETFTKREYVKLKVYETLLSVIQYHINHSSTLHCLLSALLSILQANTGIDFFSKEENSRIFIEILGKYLNHPTIVREVMTILTNIAKTIEVQLMIGSITVSSVVSVVSEGEDGSSSDASFNTIHFNRQDLLKEVENQKNCCLLLRDALSIHLHQKEMVLEIANTIAKLGKVKNNQIQFGLSGIITLLVKALEEHQENILVVISICRAIRSITISNEEEYKWKVEGSIEKLVKTTKEGNILSLTNLLSDLTKDMSNNSNAFFSVHSDIIPTLTSQNLLSSSDSSLTSYLQSLNIHDIHSSSLGSRSTTLPPYLKNRSLLLTKDNLLEEMQLRFTATSSSASASSSPLLPNHSLSSLPSMTSSSHQNRQRTYSTKLSHSEEESLIAFSILSSSSQSHFQNILNVSKLLFSEQNNKNRQEFYLSNGCLILSNLFRKVFETTTVTTTDPTIVTSLSSPFEIASLLSHPIVVRGASITPPRRRLSFTFKRSGSFNKNNRRNSHDKGDEEGGGGGSGPRRRLRWRSRETSIEGRDNEEDHRKRRFFRNRKEKSHDVIDEEGEAEIDRTLTTDIQNESEEEKLIFVQVIVDTILHLSHYQENRESFGQYGCCRSLIKSIERYSYHMEMMLLLLPTIKILAISSSSNKIRFGNVGGCLEMITLLRQWTAGDPQIILLILQSIIPLTEETSNQVLFGEISEIANDLLKIFHDFLQNYPIIESLSEIIMNLMKTKANIILFFPSSLLSATTTATAATSTLSPSSSSSISSPTTNIFEILVEALTIHSKQPLIVLNLVRIIRSLTSLPTTANEVCIRLGNVGCCEALTSLIQKHLSSSSSSSPLPSPRIRQQQQQGDLSSSLSSSSVSPSHLPILEEICQIITILCSSCPSTQNKQLFYTADVCQELCKILKSKLDFPEILYYCIEAITTLAENYTEARIAFRKGARNLMEILSIHSGNRDLVMILSLAMIAICYNNENNQRTFGELKGPKLLVIALFTHQTSALTVETIVKAMIILAEIEENKIQFGKEAGCEAIHECLVIHQFNKLVIISLFEITKSLAFRNEMNRKRFEKIGTFTLLGQLDVLHNEMMISTNRGSLPMTPSPSLISAPLSFFKKTLPTETLTRYVGDVRKQVTTTLQEDDENNNEDGDEDGNVKKEGIEKEKTTEWTKVKTNDEDEEELKEANPFTDESTRLVTLESENNGKNSEVKNIDVIQGITLEDVSLDD